MSPKTSELLEAARPRGVDYAVYKRYKGRGIGGDFNLPAGTICKLSIQPNGTFLVSPDHRFIVALNSEPGFQHFRPNTDEGKHRQALIDSLEKFYKSKKSSPYFEEDIYYQALQEADNDYWLYLLRTMPTERLEMLHQKRIGGKVRCTSW